MTATVNPERAQKVLNSLIEEMFPEVAKDRENAVDKALKIMESEKEKVYSVSKAGESFKKTPFSKLQTIMKSRRTFRKRGR